MTAMPEEFDDNNEELNQPPSFFPREVNFDEGDDTLIQVQVQGIYSVEDGGPLVVVVSDGEQDLPIVIGQFEASAISTSLEGIRYDRPMTHDLIKTILDRVGVTLDRVIIDDVWSGTYYAKMKLKAGKEELEIDARPSDALALAVRYDCPVFVSARVLQSSTE